MKWHVKRGISWVLCAILLLSPLTVGASLEELVPALSWKEKLSADVVSRMEAADTAAAETIPVYVWLKDISQTLVDAQVERETGLTRESLSVVTEAIPDSLVQSLYALSAGEQPTVNVADEMQTYLERTEPLRAVERQRTDTYIMARREIAREEYVEKNDGVLAACEIPQADVLFRSQYAPMLILSLTPAQIETVAKHPQVESVEPYVEPEETVDTASTLSGLVEYSGISQIHTELGLTGDGVKIGMVETNSVFNDSEHPIDRFITVGEPYAASNSHVQFTSNILAGADGVAPEVTVYSVAAETNTFFEGTELLLSYGVKAINCSWGIYYLDLNNNILFNDYPAISRWTDHIISVHNVSFVASAGNKFGNTASESLLHPASADNAISITGYDDQNTSDPADDRMGPYSYLNEIGSQIGCLKPDIAGPATIGGVIGTSISAPVVSGVIALMLELRPSLAAYPQAIKAILLASCHRKALKYAGDTDPQETMEEGLTDKQGAGVMDAYIAICITGSGHYGVREISGQIVDQDIQILQPSYGASGLNVSIAWLRENTVSGDHNQESSVTAGRRWDLDLKVSYGSISKSSSNTNSSTEMVYISPLPATDEYTIHIKKVTNVNGTVRYGYAWSLNNEQFQNVSEYEGIYYLKNKASGQYLQLNTDRYTYQQSFSGSETQQWLIQQSGGSYLIRPVSSTLSGVLGRGVDVPWASGYSYGAVPPSGNTMTTLQFNPDGSFTLKQEQYNSSAGYYFVNALGLVNGATTSGTPAAWSLYNSQSDAQKWYLEPLAYRKGNVDRNGLINSNDARLVSQSTVGTVTLTDVQFYLADMDNDGTVNSNDWRLVLQAATS